MEPTDTQGKEILGKVSDVYKLDTVKHKTNDHKTLKKYTTKRDPMTNVCHIEMSPFDLKVKGKQKKGRFYYGVRIVTGCQATAGTASHVYMELIGNNVQTGRIDIEVHLKVFQTSDATFDDYIIECNGDLGEVQLVTLANKGYRTMKSEAGWYVDFTYVLNLQTGTEQIFPFYHWIGDGDSFTISAHCATLKQIQHIPIIIQKRQQQLDERKKTYVWLINEEIGIPSGIDTIGKQPPLDEKFEKVKHQNFLGNRYKALAFGVKGGISKVAKQVMLAALGKRVNDFQSAESFHTFYEIAQSLEAHERKCAPGQDKALYMHSLRCYEGSRWTSDVEFGRNILNGVNCTLIERCTQLPSNFPVTNQMVQHLLCRRVSLEDEMREGYVYICNLSEIMDGLACNQGYYCASPLCLLYVNPAGRLMPIAIQLQRNPGEDNPIFLPTDKLLDWLLAKMYFASASYQHHQISTHYAGCHATAEAYGVATMRTIPDAHPLYKLLRPAIHYTMAINTAGRRSLIPNGGVMDNILGIGGDTIESGKNELFRRHSAKYGVHASNIKRSLVARGVGDADKLPNYYYRDDGVRLWDAIESFVKSIIDLFYTNDDDVMEDTEVKEWAHEVHNFGFPAYRTQEQGRGFPEQIKTKNELIEYCTLVIFTAAIHHSAVNFGQFQSYGFIPNGPSNMRRLPPTKKNVTTQDDIMQSLPSVLIAGLSIAYSYALSNFSDDEIFLGGYPTMWFTGKDEKACATAFLDSLRAINADITERNKTLDVPYKHLLPERCPNSITI